MRIIPILTALMFLASASAEAAMQLLDISNPKPYSNLKVFDFGTATNPKGDTLTVNGMSLLANGHPFIPVMGEFHFTRYPRAEWRDELLKIKAGGIDIVSTYVFWIHHEETQGQFNWQGNHDLHAFVQLCGELNLKCIIRCGPWDHGEVRNGGFPDWLINEHLKLRSNDPAYLAEVKTFYQQIAMQLKGTLWKDGGPVIGIQIENEFGGSPEHLLTLRQMAIDAGLDVPLYTRTGWPEMKTSIAFGKLLPLYGGYAEGFWDRHPTTMPGKYWKEFAFKTVRTDTAIASEHFGDRTAEDAPDIDRYPYLTCEVGAGMMCSYHRRISVFATDPLSMLIVKLGSGSNLPGYYMYHGGTNPDGIEPELEERQNTQYTNFNDLPVKTYDFQTALGEFGQIRPQYNLLKTVHLFLNDFGDRLATMSTVLPDLTLTKTDTDDLRYGVRTDGQSGFVFINNYQRLLSMPTRPDTQFNFKLKSGNLIFPSAPTTIASDHAFFWPFNFDLGDGINLSYATAQPICNIDDGKTQYTLFADTGNPAEFAFEVSGTNSGLAHILKSDVKPGLTPVAEITAANGKKHCIVFLSQTDALHLWKGPFAGRDRAVLTSCGVIFDDHSLRLESTDPSEPTLAILPAVDGMHSIANDGVFHKYPLVMPALPPINVTIQQIKPAGALRTVSMGASKVAQAPVTSDFDQAAVWHLQLPPGTDPARHLLMRIHYIGDVARAYLGEKLIDDNFYNATPFDIGVNRFGTELLKDGITLKVLPLQQAAPIYMLDTARPDFAGKPAVVALQSVDVVESRQARLSAP